MPTKEEIQAKLTEIEKQINVLREQGLKLIGQLELLEEQSKTVPATPQ